MAYVLAVFEVCIQYLKGMFKFKYPWIFFILVILKYLFSEEIKKTVIKFDFVCVQGIGGTARDMYAAAAREHEERGVTGAVGGVLRQIPGTIVKPIILASEATRHVLGGVKNQFVPDARQEAGRKWKDSENNDN